jgi:hypothetical protein
MTKEMGDADLNGWRKATGKRQRIKEKLEDEQVANVGASGAAVSPRPANECGWAGEKEHARKKVEAKSARR